MIDSVSSGNFKNDFFSKKKIFAIVFLLIIFGMGFFVYKQYVKTKIYNPNINVIQQANKSLVLPSKVTGVKIISSKETDSQDTKNYTLIYESPQSPKEIHDAYINLLEQNLWTIDDENLATNNASINAHLRSFYSINLDISVQDSKSVVKVNYFSKK